MPYSEFLTGQAGTGKTFSVKERIENDPEYGILTATTGIAATNLDTITVNSLLGYYDTYSLEEASKLGRLRRRLVALATGEQQLKNIIIDEVSMMDGRALDILWNELKTIERSYGIEIGLILTGDFAQLPPVKAPFAFEAQCWGPCFDSNTIRLTKIYRQKDKDFLDALNWVRIGNGYKAIKLLNKMGVECSKTVDNNFEGLTIKSTNREVEPVNRARFEAIDARLFQLRSIRRGKPRSEWKNIPDVLDIKIGALVMILSNKNIAGVFEYVNGDIGFIEDYDEQNQKIAVRLKRDGRLVQVDRIVRENKTKNENTGQWMVEGDINYMPVRLAYAATVHKTQGLTLDKIQVDVRGLFFKNPGMVYVAMSRCRGPEGLRIVGSPEILAHRTMVDERVKKWL